uniref:Uncharacterized protein n=1 Tax=Sphaerodactylus townsendi TaxID=933632 RepID=A0ACB8FS99_9SAUR
MVSLWCCLPAGLVSGNGLVISSSPGFPYEEDGPNTIWFPQLGHHELSPLHPSSSCRVINIVYLAQGFHWSLGEAMCKFNHTLTFVNLYASIHFLMVISIDRCISVICPVWTRNHRRPRLACFVALGVWIWAMVLSSPYIHFRKTVKNGDEIYCYDKYSDNVEQAKVIHCVMVISRFIFTFVIPFPVIIFCYGAIVLRLRRDRLASSSKPFKVIMAVILAFFICWFPFHVFSFLNIQGYEDHSLHLPLIIGNTLAYSLTLINSCLNPILYVFMVHDFKKKLKSSILSQKPLSSQPFNAFVHHSAKNRLCTYRRVIMVEGFLLTFLIACKCFEWQQENNKEKNPCWPMCWSLTSGFNLEVTE